MTSIYLPKITLNLLSISDLIQFCLYSIFKKVIYTHCFKKIIKKINLVFFFNKKNFQLFFYKKMNFYDLIYKKFSIYFHLRKVIYTHYYLFLKRFLFITLFAKKKII